MRLEDSENSAQQAKKNFVWNQLKTMEEEYTWTIKRKKVEVKQATEAAKSFCIMLMSCNWVPKRRMMKLLDYK